MRGRSGLAATLGAAVLVSVTACSGPTATTTTEPSGGPASTSSIAASTTAPAVLPESDEFNESKVDGWDVMLGDDVGDGTKHSIAVGKGVLRLQPARSWWANDTRGLFISRSVTGDFVVTAKVKVTGVKAAKPTANWTLSGIIVRNPASTAADEDWVSLRTGVVDGKWVRERKTTLNSTSTLVLQPSEAGWDELRVARLGSRFLILTRSPGGEWTRWYSYTRADLPATLQVGIDGFSGYDSWGADLVASVDWVHFRPTGVPADQAEADDPDALRAP